MPRRESMNISLPPDLRAWVVECADGGGYGTVSEYVRELVREDRKRREKADIDAQLLTALGSGPAAAMTAKDWAHVRAQVANHVSNREGRRAGGRKKRSAG